MSGKVNSANRKIRRSGCEKLPSCRPSGQNLPWPTVSHHVLDLMTYRWQETIMIRMTLLATLVVSATTSALCAKERILLHRIGPSHSTLFIAKTDGSDERPLLPNSPFDYNASLSADSKWIIFTSHLAV